MGADTFPELYDSDILVLEKILQKVSERKKAHLVMEDFRKEVVERFGEAGYEVDVKVWYTNQMGTYAYEIEVVGKTDAQPFDHERMHHEVTHDILGIDGAGTIDANGILRPPS